MEKNEKQFISGFNAGYLMAEYEPQMLTTLLKSVQPVNSYISGMTFGQKEYELESTKTRIGELDNLRNKNKEDLSREQ
jgi:hypothetical protein